MAGFKRFGSTQEGLAGSVVRCDLARLLQGEAALHLGIADALELLADQLPGRIELDLVAALQNVLEPSWDEHLNCHEELIMPLIERAGLDGPDTLAEIALLDREHYQIAGVNDEVIEQLMRLASGERLNYETFGYILRGAFEGRRRHLDWETTFFGRVLFDGRAAISGDLLESWCAGHRRPVLPEALRVKVGRLVTT